MQHTLIAIRFRDATFYKKKPRTFSPPTYYATGILSSAKKTHITLSYSLKDTKPYRGLLLPIESIIESEMVLEKSVNNKNKKVISDLYEAKKKGVIPSAISATWQDVVHFSHGVLPKKPTGAYTEGTLVHVDNEKIVIANPHTLLISDDQQTRNHPGEKGALFLAIPLPLITHIEMYGL